MENILDGRKTEAQYTNSMTKKKVLSLYLEDIV